MEADFLRISVGHQIGRAYNHFWQECALRLRPHRITPKQFSMLSLVCRNPGISQQEICERTVSKAPLVAGLLQSLAKRKLIRRKTSPDDRRRRLWWPTPTGVAKEDVLQRKVLDAEQHVCDRCGFTNLERDNLFALLLKINGHDGGEFLAAQESGDRLSPSELRTAASRFATGVTVITVGTGGKVHGMTANSFLSVSLKPPLVLFSLKREARMRRMLTVGKTIGISILAHGQEAVSDHFANRRKARFDGELFDDRRHKVQTIKGAHATYQVSLEDIVKAGDHELFLCQVDEASIEGGRPLLFHAGSYASIA